MGARCNHGLRSQSRLTCMSSCAGVTVGEISNALNLQAATLQRGIDAIQMLIGDAHLKDLELHTFGQAIEKHHKELFEAEEGVEVVCTMLGTLP